MTITLSWYMLVPIVWIAGIFGMVAVVNNWFFDVSDWKFIGLVGVIPAILMLLTRFLP